MFLDANLQFSAAQALTTTAPSTLVIDLLGVGTGNASQNIIGNASVFGEDIGIGSGPGIPTLLVLVTTTMTGGTSVNVQFQGAIDNGSNAPGTYNTYGESGAVVTASLLAGTMIWRQDVPAVIPWSLGVGAGPMPRFIRLNYLIVGTYGAGAISAYIIRDRADYAARMYPSNFVVA